MYIDAVESAWTMATTMAERDREKYKRPRDIIEHAKKYEAYNFYGTLDLGQVDQNRGESFYNSAIKQWRKDGQFLWVDVQ